MWSYGLFLLSLVAGSQQLSITEFLVPAALETGQDANLQCKYDLLKNESESALFVKWWWTPLNSTSDQRYQLYQRIAGYRAEAIHHYHDNFEIDENDGIKLVNVSFKDSGIYECEVSNIDEVREHKKLVVYSIGSGPSLNISVAEDSPKNALATCTAFDVAPHPDISILLNGEAVESSGFVSEQEDGLYMIQENASIPLDKANNGEFRCEIFFKDKDIPHAPYVTIQTFEAPIASTPEPEEPAVEPSAAASEPKDNGSNRTGNSWMLLMFFILYYGAIN